MKFGVVSFPGSNCDQDMIYILRDILGQCVVSLWHKDTNLKGADMVVLPGGFSYGDYLRSGSLAKFSPIMNEVISHSKKGGFVLGICNGFQILTESGLLDGTLLHNNSQRFICKNVWVKPISKTSAITKGLSTTAKYKIPIAHGEGRYFAPDKVLHELEENEQVLFRYVDKEGVSSLEANPNGSLNNIAGITNKNKNVFGMMPHPERAADINLNNTDGISIFESILAHC
ncbi:MAG: phosphoribosylformylglycinamidine synthase subunit PurQ [Bacteroidetes bacterium]|nr:phosphoribosylformylglycinamidine synthase subunit PurQ [Bacteroidota bacterium]